jgi:hypothetical protein
VKAAAVALVLLSAVPLLACDTPVYRYALENWPADSYQATVLHRGALSVADQSLVQRLQTGARSANLTVHLIDQTRPDDPEVPARFHKIDVATGPVLILTPPAATKPDADTWCGRLTEEAVDAVLDSPVRRQVASRLHAGEIVWLFLESGHAREDQAATQVISDNCPALPPSTVIRLRRDDVHEQLLVRMLLDSEPDLPDRNEPMAFPVFGRGRLLYALVGRGITADNVRQAAGFLGGDCSCTVKRDNPGTDLLVMADWSDVTAASDLDAPAMPTVAASASLSSQVGGSSRAVLWVALAFAGGLVVLTGTRALRSRKPRDAALDGNGETR